MTRWAPFLAGLFVLWLLAGRGFALAIGVAVMVAVWRLRGDTRAERKRRPWTLVERRVALHRAGYRCEDCGSPHELELDHFVPFSMGGACDLSNVRVLCSTCNKRKGSKDPREYYQ